VTCFEILSDVTVKITPTSSKKVTFVNGVPDFENPENMPRHRVVDDLMDSAYSTKVRQLLSKTSHHRNISLVLIAHNLFHQGPPIPFNSNYIVVFKNPKNKTQIVHLARQVYPETFLVFIRHI